MKKLPEKEIEDPSLRNLAKSPSKIPAASFHSPVDLEKQDEKVLESIAEQQIGEQFKPSEYPKFIFQENEDIRIISMENRNKVVYEGEVSLPQFSNGGGGSVQLD